MCQFNFYITQTALRQGHAKIPLAAIPNAVCVTAFQGKKAKGKIVWASQTKKASRGIYPLFDFRHFCGESPI